MSPSRPKPLNAFVVRFRAVLQLDDTPRSIVLGLFYGTIIGWTPTVGLQMIIAVLVASALRVNRLAAVVMVWISNPLTMIPMYWLEYVVGKHVMSWFGVVYSPWTQERFRELFETLMGLNAWDALVMLGRTGASLLWPMTVGGSLIGVMNGAVLAIVVFRYLTSRGRPDEHEPEGDPDAHHVEPPSAS